MACGDTQAAPKIAILDPSLTLTQPARVTACTGLDAIGHAVETAVTTKRNAASTTLSFAAFELAQQNFPRVLSDPEDLKARGAMLKAAAFAGAAIEHSMLGAAHAAANPLTARCGISHGHAVGLMLPHVVRFNALESEIGEIYADLARRGGVCSADTADSEAIELLIARLDSVLQATGLPSRLEDLGVDGSSHEALAEEAVVQWTAQFNPRPVAVADFQTLLGMAS
jgi:alcohol dehydrogenase